MNGDELDRAACRGKPTRWWYPLAVGNTRSYRMPVAKWRETGAPALAVCATCTVQAACLAEAIGEYDWHGIRGGLTPPEIRKIAGSQRRFVRAPHGTHSRYSSGCRCADCTYAHTEYARGRRAS